MTGPPTIPPDIACASDYERLARERTGPQAWAYLNGGAADELTLHDNRAAFDRLRLRARVLRPLDGGDTALTLFGQRLEHPILVAPMAFQKLAHPDGELATVLGAAALKAAMVVSTQASVELEAIAASAGTPLWFQLYIQADRDFTRTLVARAERAGYGALVVTVDAPVNGLRHREQRTGFQLPAGIEAVNLRGLRLPATRTAAAGESAVFGSGLLTGAPTWTDIDWLRGLTRLPILLKGITHAEDALLAVEHGVDGLIVSNHGGRTLDTLPATIELLPEMAQAVGNRLPVLLDGGVRRGTDILKALALGARAVLVGRPCLHALSVAGAVGVAHLLHLLRAELEVAMALTGCRKLEAIDTSVLHPARIDSSLNLPARHP